LKSILMRRTLILVIGTLFIVGTLLFYTAYGRRDKRAVPPGFVTTDGARFVIDGKPFRFIGANVAVMYREDDRQRMAETLRVAAEHGIKVIRIWAFGEGDEENGVRYTLGDRDDWPRLHSFRSAPDQWNEDAFIHLDKVIAEAEKNNLKVQLCLTNWWHSTGGVIQYLNWIGINNVLDEKSPTGMIDENAMVFYTNEEAKRLYRQHIDKIVLRRNSITGKFYRDDPTIMAYELMNEAQAPTGLWHQRRAWVAEMSAYIKSLDPNHLVTPGTWGYRFAVQRREWLEEHKLPTIDFCDVHHYPTSDLDSHVKSPAALHEFMDNRVAAAVSINKPLVWGEFGMWPEGYNEISAAEWYRSFFDHTIKSGASGSMFWILTPAMNRGFGVSYTNPRDQAIFAEIRRAAQLIESNQAIEPPKDLRREDNHLIPRQFSFARSEGDSGNQPLIVALEDKSLLYRFAPEQAIRGSFEKLGSGHGYIWGDGPGFLEYIVPARESWRRVSKIVVRARIQPPIPWDANGRVKETRVNLHINGRDCGSRIVPLEINDEPVTQEWHVDSIAIRAAAIRGKPLSIMFVVDPSADKPYGINITKYPHNNIEDKAPVEVEVRR
jgi:mannan endo-1,4-beta-mannosidase